MQNYILTKPFPTRTVGDVLNFRGGKYFWQKDNVELPKIYFDISFFNIKKETKYKVDDTCFIGNGEGLLEYKIVSNDATKPVSYAKSYNNNYYDLKCINTQKSVDLRKSINESVLTKFSRYWFVNSSGAVCKSYYFEDVADAAKNTNFAKLQALYNYRKRINNAHYTHEDVLKSHLIY
jgi:hypothetical protein